MSIPYGYCHCGCGAKTPLASKTRLDRGVKKGEPMKWLHKGHSRRKSGVDYLEQDCGYETPCWVWQLGKSATGYGRIWADGKARHAYRVFWERANGPVPSGLVLDHLCVNPPCVNPAHLEPVTHRENIRRGIAKLTAGDVAVIRGTPRSIAHPELAARFGVARSTIADIRNTRHTWPEVEAA